VSKGPDRRLEQKARGATGTDRSMERQMKHPYVRFYRYRGNYVSAIAHVQTRGNVRQGTALREGRMRLTRYWQRLAVMTRSRSEIRARQLGRKMAISSGEGIVMATSCRVGTLEVAVPGAVTMSSAVDQCLGIIRENSKASVKLDVI